jgi:hypothetical protein
MYRLSPPSMETRGCGASAMIQEKPHIDIPDIREIPISESIFY